VTVGGCHQGTAKPTRDDDAWSEGAVGVGGGWGGGGSGGGGGVVMVWSAWICGGWVWSL